MARSDIKSYMQQWLQTASKGNISVDYARFQDRMELRCKACNAIFRCSLPSNPTEIDWSVQDWVTKHVPGGVHDMEKAEIAKAQDEDANEKALQNLLNRMINAINASISPEMMMKKFKSPEGTIPSKEPDVVFTGSKKLKNAVIAIGRRFR